MTAADPRVCCWACELPEVDDGCSDLHCSCHDGIAAFNIAWHAGREAAGYGREDESNG